MLCAYCHKELASKDRSIWPFCSIRCKEADLGKWVRGEYVVPGKEIDQKAEVPDREDNNDNSE